MPALPFKTEAEWLALREEHVGGSEIASLFYNFMLPDGSETVLSMFDPVPDGAINLGCLSTYRTGYRLYWEKCGRIMPDDMKASERVNAGRFLEPALAAWAEDKFGWRLRKTRRYLVHPSVPGWGCSLDYELVEAGKGYPPVEFKNVDFLIYRDQWVEDDDGVVVMPPLHIMLQMQTQIGAAECDHGHIVVCVGGNELKRGMMQIHAPSQEKIGKAINQFWQAIFDKADPREFADYDTVAELNRYGVNTDEKAPVDLTGEVGLDVLARRLIRYRKHANFVEGQIDGIKARIAAIMGEATRARGPNGLKLSWPRTVLPAKMVPERWQEERTYRGNLFTSFEKPKNPRKAKKDA